MADNESSTSFIGKLALMIKDMSAEPYITWSAGGESIVVVDPTGFVQHVLPRCAHDS